MTTTLTIESPLYYVAAVPRRDGLADCTFYVKEGGTYEPASPPLSVPKNAGRCDFAQYPNGNSLSLQAAVFATLPISGKLGEQDYVPIENILGLEVVRVPMPIDPPNTVEKGVVLIFSNSEGRRLFPSADPVIRIGNS
jgi:hypothetical protein